MAFFDSANLHIERQPDGSALLWVDVVDRPFNVFNRQVIADFDAALDQVAAEPSIQLLIILSRKPSGFFAGADLHEFTAIASPSEASQVSARGQRLFDKLANLAIPTVALIHGPCLGGGLECVLACDYRVILDQPGTQIGLPEIKLGLLPAWGGTQRLPRVVGLERAFLIILQQKVLNATEALQWGLADAVEVTPKGAPAGVNAHLLERFRRQGKRHMKGLPLRGLRQRLLESTPAGRWLLFRGVRRILQRKVPDDMPAPVEAFNAVREGLARGIAEGLAFERDAIGRLATTKACRNLVTLFFLIEQARKSAPATGLPSEGNGKTLPGIRKVGIVGAGAMGAGIAQLAAIKGFDLVIQEVNEGALAAGIKKIEALFSGAVKRHLLSSEEARKKLTNMGKTVTWEGFDQVDIVVEAAIEDLEKKREIFQELDRRTRPDAILATNTSSLSVGQLQDGLGHPHRVAGLHFFNPVHKMPLVEVVRTPETNSGIESQLAQWAAALGKTPVIVKDSPGFLVNRILMPYLNEAGMLVAEGMPVDQVDHVMRRFGMPMGPLELLDQIGLDVAAHVAKAVGPVFSARLMPHPALERMCARGWLGQKSGKGFYVYQGRKKTVHAEALAQLETEGGKPAASTESFSERGDAARDRMVYLMLNEAALCLEEGLCERPEVIDLAMVLGTGWAPHRGGPLRYTDDQSALLVVRTLEGLTQKHGRRFEPCQELRRRAASGQLFYPNR